MREIKFRAWNGINKTMRGPVTLKYIIEDDAIDVLEEISFMQYTGLKDKNGKEIYEGDIVDAFCGTQRTIVKFCNERGGYFFDDCIVSGDADPSSECLGNLTGTLEVIGNIYENPELIE